MLAESVNKPLTAREEQALYYVAEMGFVSLSSTGLVSPNRVREALAVRRPVSLFDLLDAKFTADRLSVEGRHDGTLIDERGVAAVYTFLHFEAEPVGEVDPIIWVPAERGRHGSGTGLACVKVVKD